MAGPTLRTCRSRSRNAAGPLISTVDDLARWIDALEGGTAVSAASRDRMFTPAVLAGGEHDGVSTRYGLGNTVRVIAGHLAHEHGGGIHGYVSDLLRVPDADLLVVVLSNNPTVSPNVLAHRIVEHALGGPLPRAPTVVLDAAALDAYVGVYRMAEAGPPGAPVERRVVTRDGDTLRLQRAGGARNPLRPLGDDRFETVEGGIPAAIAGSGRRSRSGWPAERRDLPAPRPHPPRALTLGPRRGFVASAGAPWLQTWGPGNGRGEGGRLEVPGLSVGDFS